MKWTPIVALGLTVVAGTAGYLATGNPGMPSAFTERAQLNQKLTSEAEQASKDLLENFGDVRAWLTLSDALIRTDRTETAVSALESGLQAIPGNADLWVQMGVALVAHAQGEVVPAARLAFDRASRLAPEHPAPSYFLGLSWLQAGNIDKALETWQELRDRSTDDAPWVAMLDEKLEAGRKMKAMGVGDMLADAMAQNQQAEAN